MKSDVISLRSCNCGNMRGLGSDGLYYDVKFIHDCLNNPVGVSNAFGGDISPDVMFAISPQMIAQYRLMALQPRRRRPAPRRSAGAAVSKQRKGPLCLRP